MKGSHGMEEYLECIYRITEEEGRRASTNGIARHLRVKQGSVTPMLRRLHDAGHVAYEEYHGVILTEKGRKLGRSLTRKHRLLEYLLHRSLHVERGKVHAEACRLEHALSDDVEKKLIAFLGRPRSCPDGKPIPYSGSAPR